jgi:ApaG protein
MYETLETNGIEIQVKSTYVAERSDPSSEQFFFAYLIRIQNKSQRPVQLLSRRWEITDGLGRTEEITGPGVIGQQPKISPGEVFEYESFCPLSTPTGTMQGSYEMIQEDGAKFQAAIPHFYLCEPSFFH